MNHALGTLLQVYVERDTQQTAVVEEVWRKCVYCVCVTPCAARWHFSQPHAKLQERWSQIAMPRRKVFIGGVTE